jgi:hypothetical protein
MGRVTINVQCHEILALPRETPELSTQADRGQRNSEDAAPPAPCAFAEPTGRPVFEGHSQLNGETAVPDVDTKMSNYVDFNAKRSV